MQNKLTTIAFALILTGMLGSQLLPDRSFSEQENRYLEQAPKFTMRNLWNGKWMKEFETYVQDQFIGRDEWMKLKSELEKGSGKKENNGIYFGKQRWYYEIQEAPDETTFKTNIQILEQMTKKLQEQGIDAKFLAIYSAYQFYQDQLPDNHRNVNQKELLEWIQSNSSVDILDTFEQLQAHKDEAIYFRTDHHWTQLGAYYAYLMLGESLGYEPMSLDAFQKKTSQKPFYGTLFSKSPLFGDPGEEVWTLEDGKKYTVTVPETNTIKQSLYDYEYFKKGDQYSVFLGGNQPEVIITGENKNQKTIVLFKDSYSHALAPLLAQHYEKVILIDLRYFNQSISKYLADVKPDEVIFSYNVSWFANDTFFKKIRS